ncbi:MAG: molybdenum cofactor guanylyltransferase [Gammaproteobacteria bacterium]|nr:molybdenum cofactor guanylyltransferase [Gammaproteobacteria bacterium]
MTALGANAVTAVILAGGMGKRMGGVDKGQVKLNNKPLIEWVIEAIRPQVSHILINANRSHDAYARYGFPVLRDQLSDYQGPLAGFAAGMQAASTTHIVTVPCDGPLLPPDLVERLIHALESQQADIAVAHDGERLQPVYALIPVSLLTSLNAFLASNDRKIDRWYAQQRMALADFSDVPSTFLNVNTPEDRERLEHAGISA